MGIGIICCEKPKEEQMKLHQPNSIFGNKDSYNKNYNHQVTNQIDKDGNDNFEIYKNLSNKKILKNQTFNNNKISIENDLNCLKSKDKKSSHNSETETDFFSNFNNLNPSIFPDNNKKKQNSNNFNSNNSLIENNFNYNNFSKIVFYIESFEFTYKKYDDYGLSLNPIIYLKTDAAHETILDKQNDNDFENCKTLTNTLTENISFNNTENLIKTVITANGENTNTISNGAVKHFYINSTYCLNLENYENWKYKILRIKIFNKSKSSQYNPIIIGCCAFPLISIPVDGVEGKIPVRNKLSKNIGHLIVRVGFMQKDGIFYGKYSQNNFENKNNAKSKKFEDDENLYIENELDENGINTNFYVPVENKENIKSFENYKNLFLSYELIDHILKEKFKIKKSDPNSKLSTEEKLVETVNLKKNHLAIINEIKIDTPIKKISLLFIEAINNSNHIILYGLIKFFINNFENFDKTHFDELFHNLFSSKKAQNFVNLYEDFLKAKNFYLTKIYFYFIYKIIIFYKNQESKTGEIQNKIVNFEEMFDLINQSLIYLYKSTGDIKNYSYEMLEELRESIYWIYSSITELITQNPTENFKDKNSIIQSNFIYFNNSLKIINDPKSLIDVFILLNEDSEITGFVSRIFRKSIQNILDDVNLYPKITDKNDLINMSLKDLIMDSEKAQKFITFVQICLMRYINYPEIYSNVLLILICLCNDSKYPEVIRTLLDAIDISLICSGFDIYRGNLRKIGKNINYFFYKLISQLISTENSSNISNKNINNLNSNNSNYSNLNSNSTFNYSMNRSDKISIGSNYSSSGSNNNLGLNINKHEIKEICNEIFKLFRLKTLGNGKLEKSKTLVQFLKNKNLELHEILCCIAANITKNGDACVNICREKCVFINTILEYFLELDKNYLEKNLEKYKNIKREKIPLYLSVIDNTLITFNNILAKNSTTKSFFMQILKLNKYDLKMIIDHVNELISACMEMFNLNGNNNIKIKNTADIFLNNLK